MGNRHCHSITMIARLALLCVLLELAIGQNLPRPPPKRRGLRSGNKWVWCKNQWLQVSEANCKAVFVDPHLETCNANTNIFNQFPGGPIYLWNTEPNPNPTYWYCSHQIFFCEFCPVCCEDGKCGPTEPPVCDIEGGWSAYGNHCYKAFEGKLSFDDAQKTCEGYGNDGHLVSIHSEGENQFVYDLLPPIKNILAWLGIFKEGLNGEPAWTDGTDVNYKNFIGSKSNRLCGAFWNGSKWNYAACPQGAVANYVCKNKGI